MKYALWLMVSTLLFVAPLRADVYPLEKTYSEMAEVATHIPHKGIAPDEKLAVLRDRQEFLSDPQHSVPLLIAKLDDLNAQETAGNSQKNSEYVPEATGRDILKMWTCFLLADLSKTSTTEHSEIGDALARSYTPAITTHQQGLTNLLWATLSMGADSVPILLHLADSTDVKLRCGAADALEQLSAKMKAGAPKINCNAPYKSWIQEIKTWRVWWDKTGSHRKFPEVPSFFDSL